MSMVTVNENVILGAIREAVAKIVSGIDLEKAKGVCQENVRLAQLEAVEIRDAGMCVHEGATAIRLKLGVSGSLSMLADLKGNCIAVVQDAAPEPASAEGKIEEVSQQAAQAHQQF